MKTGCSIAVSLCAAAMCVLPSGLHALAEPQTNDPTYTVAGRIVGAGSADGIQGARISITVIAFGSPSVNRTTSSGADGSFSLAGLPKGTAWILASKAGWLTGQYGQTSLGDIPQGLTLKDSRSPAPVTVNLWRAGAITGRARTPAGVALAHARISVFQQKLSPTRDEWQLAGATRSDDRGEYRVENLVPGTYIVGTDWSAGESDGAVPHDVGFYPDGRTLADAVRLTLGAGAELTGIDVSVGTTSSQQATRIRGVVRGASGVVPGFPLRLVPETGLFPPGFNERSTETNAQGEFSVSGLLAGSYLIRGCSGDADAPRADTLESIGGVVFYNMRPKVAEERAQPPSGVLCGQALVDASDPVTNVDLNLTSAKRVTGSVRLDRTSVGTGEQQAIRVFFLPVERGPFRNVPLVEPADDGSFVSPPLPPGNYLIEASTLPPGKRASWRTTSVLVSGRERLGLPAELGGDGREVISITLSDRVTTVLGTVRDASGLPVAGARVLMFPSDKSLRVFSPTPLVSSRVLQTRTDQYGAFEREVVPGSYLVSTFQGPLPLDWQSPDFFERLSKTSMPANVALGDRKVVALTAR